MTRIFRHPGSASPALAGALLMLGAMALLSAADGIAKELGRLYPILMVVWARYAFNLLAVAPPLLQRHRLRELLPPRLLLQVARGGFLLTSTALYFTALAVMPLADALVLTFVAPLIVAALSPWLLRERVDRRTYVAVAVGFAGTLLITRPGAGVLQPGALLALGAGASYAFFMITTRELSDTAPPLVTLGWTAAVGTLATSLLLPFAWRSPDAMGLLLMTGLGAGTALAHFLIIRAFATAPAALMAPLTYLEIVGAAAVGYLAFGDIPDAQTWLGAAVIVASGVVITLGERPAPMRPKRAPCAPGCR